MIVLRSRKTHIFVDNPAAAYIPDRGFDLNATNEAVTHQIKQRLEKCLASHQYCGAMSNIHHFLPTRVIDVNRMQLHISRPGEAEPYTALSYCWGGPQVFKTTTETFPAMVESIQLDSMPQTLQDAVHVTRQIGIRYLWIDCLCIIQDLPADIASEVDKMHWIYNNSAVTIAAEDPHSVGEGFLHPHVAEVNINVTRGAVKLPFDCGDGISGSIYLAPSNDVAKVGGLRKRAWAFQEIVLSPRLLIYSTQGIIWSCFSEHIDVPIFGRWGSQVPNDLYSQRRNSRAAVRDARLTPAMLKTDRLRRHLWRDVLLDYLPLELSFAEDRLPALAGIAKYYQEALEGTYVAGMWKEDLLMQLGWQRDDKVFTTLRKGLNVALLPSWSWVSICGSIKFPNFDTPYEETWRANVISCEVKPQPPEAPFGQVKSGTLELDAYKLPLFDVHYLLKHGRCVLDKPYDEKLDLGTQYRCLVLGLRVNTQNARNKKELNTIPEVLDGLCLKRVSDGIYQRIGFFTFTLLEFGRWRGRGSSLGNSCDHWEEFLRTGTRRHHWVII